MLFRSSAAALLKLLGGVLGILQRDPVDFLRRRRDVTVMLTGVEAKTGVGNFTVSTPSGLPDDQIEKSIEQRNVARNAKNFSESDRIRDKLLAAGIVLEDGPAGTTWRRK